MRDIIEFREWLIKNEKSWATIEKYERHVNAGTCHIFAKCSRTRYIPALFTAGTG